MERDNSSVLLPSEEISDKNQVPYPHMRGQGQTGAVNRFS